MEASFTHGLFSLSFSILPILLKCFLFSQLVSEQFSTCGLGITGQAGRGEYSYQHNNCVLTKPEKI